MFLTSPTIIFRPVGDYWHFLNFTSGDVMSFNADDGKILAENLLNWETLDLSDELSDFFGTNNHLVNSRLCRSALVELGMEFSFPTTVNIELNRRCVLNCQHCYISHAALTSKNDELFDTFSISQIEIILDNLVEMGVFLVVLTGGEPFLNKNLERFVQIANEKGLIIELFSNLQFLPDWLKQHKATDFSIGRIQTSVYSHMPDIHDAVTGNKGSHKRTLRNLQWLKKQGYYVEVATPLMSLNFESREQTWKFFNGLNIVQSFAWPINDEYYVAEKTKARLNITKEQFLQFCQENPDFISKVDCSDLDSPICAAGNALFSISANGDVFPCSQYPQKIGNITSESLPDIWLSPKMRRIANYLKRDIAEIPLLYNFCMGNNYTETGHPLQMPLSLKEVFEFYEQKGGE